MKKAIITGITGQDGSYFFVVDINNVSGIAYNWDLPEYTWLKDRFDKYFIRWCKQVFQSYL